MKLETAQKLVLDEVSRARSKHPAFNSCHEGYAVLLEEVDELWAEIKADKGISHRAVSEAVQIAAVALMYLIELCPEKTSVTHTTKVREWERDTSAYGGYSG